MKKEIMDTETLKLFVENIWSTTLALSFWLLVGLLIAGILHVIVPDSFVRRHLGHSKGAWAVFKAVIFGVPMPLCSCGVIPAALGIKKQGAGDGASIGFLISTPQTGIDSIMVSASMLGLPFAIFKLASAFVIGIAGGLWAYFFDENDIENPKNNEDKNNDNKKRGFADIFVFAIDDLLKMVWKWLVFGVIISAAISTWLPHDFFTNYLPDNIIVEMLIVLLISLPMYICATASVPIAAALVTAGMPTGAALVFLMAGPASNVATIGAVYRAFGLKKLMIYLISVVVGSMLGGLIFDSVINPAIPTQEMQLMNTDSMIANISAIILVVMLLRFLILDIKSWLRERIKADYNTESKVLTVDGMTCDGCASKLKTALMLLPTIQNVKITLSNKQVEIFGQYLHHSKIEATIVDVGFRVENK